MIFGYIVLLVAFTLSIVSAYYSVLGLVSIFAAAVIPVVIMGASLEVGKVTAALWLHKNWNRSPVQYKLYLVPAVIFLMLLTSMGVFGFLSKAHSDQSLVSGDVQAKIAIYDEKIKVSQDNIDVNRKALKQLDEAVDQVMGRSTSETGADKAVAVRRSQAKERTRMLAEITAEQKKITGLREERAPIAAEVRKVEAEVGPIKYIAAMVYGDNPESSVLEKAVRWVIVLIVIVFDPLAIVLILAGQRHLVWAREDRKALALLEAEKAASEIERTEYEPEPEYVKWPGGVGIPEPVVEKEFDINDHPYLFTPVGSRTPPGIDPVPPQVYRPEEPSDTELDPCYKCGTPLMNAPGIGPFCPNKECDVIDGPFNDTEEPIEIVYIPLEPWIEPIRVITSNKSIPIETVAELEETNNPAVPQNLGFAPKPMPVIAPETMQLPAKTVVQVLEAFDPKAKLSPVADNDENNNLEVNAQFGTSFPASPNKGDLFLRVDYLPTRLFRYNGIKWMEADKSLTDTYSYNEEYIAYLVEQVGTGKYDPDDLSDSEKFQIEEFLKKNVK